MVDRNELAVRIFIDTVTSVPNREAMHGGLKLAAEIASASFILADIFVAEFKRQQEKLNG